MHAPLGMAAWALCFPSFFRSLARYVNTWLANVDRKRIDEDERETTAGRAEGISIMDSFGTRAPNVIDPSSRKSCAGCTGCTAHPSLFLSCRVNEKEHYIYRDA